jgi:hypothetical protein
MDVKGWGPGGMCGGVGVEVCVCGGGGG